VRILVCTVVHNPTDARVFRREIGALLDAGNEVLAIAPWQPQTPGDERVIRYPIPRAVGRNRFEALRAARSRIRDLAPKVDVVMVHDPELLLVLPWAVLKQTKTPVIWDVHEDLAAAITTKSYIPTVLRSTLSFIVRRLEKVAERKCTLILAESAYQERFTRQHQAVLNLPLVADSLPNNSRLRQAIYVGSITQHRGLGLMLELANQLAPHGIAIRLIGETHNESDTAAIKATKNVSWDGPLPNAEAMREVEQSMVGLSLLADIPNYQHSMPTKILEYMASGAVVVSTPLPLAVDVIEEDGVVLAGFDSTCVEQAVGHIVELVNNEAARTALTKRAFERVKRDYNWNVAGKTFATYVQSISKTR
jgi:glycosyltransferase involved in cell wall biosynthesis